jgi:nucleotide-binding universal stress UspA family protein
MLSVGHILVATDLTPRFTVALQRAAGLKQRLAAKLTVMHVLDRAPVTLGPEIQVGTHQAQGGAPIVCNDGVTIAKGN